MRLGWGKWEITIDFGLVVGGGLVSFFINFFIKIVFFSYESFVKGILLKLNFYDAVRGHS